MKWHFCSSLCANCHFDRNFHVNNNNCNPLTNGQISEHAKMFLQFVFPCNFVETTEYALFFQLPKMLTSDYDYDGKSESGRDRGKCKCKYKYNEPFQRARALCINRNEFEQSQSTTTMTTTSFVIPWIVQRLIAQTAIQYTQCMSGGRSKSSTYKLRFILIIIEIVLYFNFISIFVG